MNHSLPPNGKLSQSSHIYIASGLTSSIKALPYLISHCRDTSQHLRTSSLSLRRAILNSVMPSIHIWGVKVGPTQIDPHTAMGILYSSTIRLYSRYAQM